LIWATSLKKASEHLESGWKLDGRTDGVGGEVKVMVHNLLIFLKPIFQKLFSYPELTRVAGGGLKMIIFLKTITKNSRDWLIRRMVSCTARSSLCVFRRFLFRRIL